MDAPVAQQFKIADQERLTENRNAAVETSTRARYDYWGRNYTTAHPSGKADGLPPRERRGRD
jgi:hypothetical protein